MNWLSVGGRGAGRLACLMVIVAALLGYLLPQVAVAEEPPISFTPSTTQPFFDCPGGGCDAISDPPVTTTASGYQLPFAALVLEGGGEKGGYDPKDLQSAYGIPETGGSGQTVAVIDAHGDETAESDLTKYREKYKVYYKGTETACTKTSVGGNGCFKKVNQKGVESEYPAASSAGWGLETSLDLDMVSAACPECHILLVEANNEEESEMGAAVDKAVELGATEVSISYGFSEAIETRCGSTDCSQYASDYDHPEYDGHPVVITVSAGDDKYDNEDLELTKPAANFPASSPDVIAVGGTALKTAKDTRGWSETVWNEPSGGEINGEKTLPSGTGSGCSLDELEPPWQEAKTFFKEACGTKRTDNDVAADAACETPVSIYSTPYFGGWANECGTSASSPFIAGVEAHAGSATKKVGAEAFYKRPRMLFHISEGSNGECGAEGSETYYLCHATSEGYNGPTGWGTPDGVFNITAAPVVTTDSAYNVKENEATLRGTVNPEGAETKYYFEYGETTSYGSKTVEVRMPAGYTSFEQSLAITGLPAGTTYHFRVVATNSDGTTYGLDEKFTTTGTAKPYVETKPATSETETGATLNGRVNPRGLATEYYFEYGTTISYGSKTAEASAGSGTAILEQSKAIAGLTASTTYHFRIVATNSKGTADGEDHTFTSPPKPSVETKTATSVSGTEATLNGTVNPHGAETKYWFEYGTEKGKLSSKTLEVSAGSGKSSVEERKTISGLTKGTEYYFRIVASNSHGTSDGGEEVFAATSVPTFVPLPTKKKFKGTSGTWEAGYGVDIFTCPSGTVTGELTGGQKLGNVVITFTGCTSDGPDEAGCPLNTEGAKSGEMVTTALTGELGTVATTEAASGVGLLLKPENNWWVTVGNGCTVGTNWRGTVAPEVAVIGKKQTTNRLFLTSNIEKIKLDSGVSEWSELETFAVPIYWTNTFEVTFEEPVEVT